MCLTFLKDMSYDKIDTTRTMIGQRGLKRYIPKPLSHPSIDLLQTPPSAHTHLDVEGKAAPGI